MTAPRSDAPCQTIPYRYGRNGGKDGPTAIARYSLDELTAHIQADHPELAERLGRFLFRLPRKDLAPAHDGDHARCTPNHTHV